MSSQPTLIFKIMFYTYLFLDLTHALYVFSVPISYNIWTWSQRKDEAAEILTNPFVASKGIDRLALFWVYRMAFGGKGKILQNQSNARY